MVLAKLKRLVTRTRPAPPREPLTPRDRLRLEHRVRSLERRKRALAKRLGDGCSTCVQQAPSPALMTATKQLRIVEAEIEAIRTRLG